jgi:hypothetical protein
MEVRMKPACRLFVLVVAAWGAALWAGTPPVTPAAPDEAAVKKEFDRLYQDYSRRFHSRMVTEGEMNKPAQIMTEGAKLWDQVFGPHKDIVRARADGILKELEDSEPVSEHLFHEVASVSRPSSAPDPQGMLIAKQYVWSPAAAAHKGLEDWLARMLTPTSLETRRLLLENAGLSWQVLKRDAEAPVLVQRQGPMLYTVSLSRQDDYYRVEAMRWLRRKTMGPVIPPPPPAPAPAAGAAPTTETEKPKP